MKIIISIVRFILSTTKLSTRLSVLDKRIAKDKKEKKKSDVELQKYKNQLSGIRDDFSKTMVKANQALDRASGIQKGLELSLEAAHQEIKIAKEITIPGLITVNETFRGSWDAQSSINEMRTVALHNPHKEIE